MAGLVPATHVLLCGAQDVGARHKAGHDDGDAVHQRDRNPPQSLVPEVGELSDEIVRQKDSSAIRLDLIG
jgi:hypothetical protein